ncbi:MAG: hypothetical protein RL701_27, partial [Pseudomonadota bacterium]
MSPQVFAILTGLVEERLGLWYPPEDQALFESKVSQRALELGFDSALDYYYCLRYDDPDGAELKQLTNTLVVNETFFFREYDQLHAVMSHFVEPLIRAGARPRVWSAACSTGEEPSTIAMWLDERGWLGAADVIASDISDAALSVARAGRYRPRSLRYIPEGVDPARWITRSHDTLLLDERIRTAIDWRQINLLDDAGVRTLGELDVVLCRNMLIYVRDDTVRRVVTRLRDRLKPGGVLLVGVSESLMRISTGLVCEEHQG